MINKCICCCCCCWYSYMLVRHFFVFSGALCTTGWQPLPKLLSRRPDELDTTTIATIQFWKNPKNPLLLPLSPYDRILFSVLDHAARWGCTDSVNCESWCSRRASCTWQSFRRVSLQLCWRTGWGCSRCRIFYLSLCGHVLWHVLSDANTNKHARKANEHRILFCCIQSEDVGVHSLYFSRQRGRGCTPNNLEH